MNNNALDTTKSLYGGKIKYAECIDTDLHYHRQFELIYLLKGKLKITAGGSVLNLDSGDIAVIKPFEQHSFEEFSENSYLLIILPDKISLKLSSQNISTKKFSVSGDDEIKLLMLYKTFLSISSDYLQQYYKLVAEIIKKLYKLETPRADANLILDYIHNHYRENISLSKVALACISNRSYVSKAVNEHTGYHFNSYINKLRIAYFLDLFSSNDDSRETIEAIAEKCGFNNPRTFYRAFFSELNCTPTEYFNLC